MGWKQSGKDDYNKVEISKSDKTIIHQSYDDKKGGKAIVTETKGGSGKNDGHTTVHGSDTVNKHGSHKDN